MFKSLVLISIIVTIVTAEELQVPEVGNAINILKFHGSLSFTMRVFPSDQDWLFLHPSVKIFKNVKSARRVLSTSTVFPGDFHLEICENYRQLFQAYFRNFTIEGVDRPWSAFMSSWTMDRIAKYFGIRESLISDHFKYIFIRITRFRDSYKLVPSREGFEVVETILEDADNVEIGDSAKTTEFVTKYSGTHFIESYTSGNSLFQVFVYRPGPFKIIKRAIRARGINVLFDREVTNYFSSDLAEFVGMLRTSSGNYSVQEWAMINLFFAHQEPRSQNILRLYGDPTLLKRLSYLLQNESLVQLNLKSIAPYFPSRDLQKWLEEFIFNNLQLWDVNL